ncbi:MAG: helix-turn-helix domain-containing protein [Candidatus Portnoybacteria bacterium]|nr:helix-turn-helix domain-containing protein [Candidatus Portnoybacteria bacterium]
MKINEILTTKEAAELLGLSDRHVRRLIKEGLIPAKKVGPNFVIEASQLNPIFQKATKKEKKFVREATKRVIKEYGETLKMLGDK